MARILRFACGEDAAAIAAIYGPFVTQTTISFEEIPPSPDEIRLRVLAASDAWPWLVCECDETVTGFAYAGPHRTRAAYRWSVDVSAYVIPAYQRRGIARELYSALFRILNLQGYYQAFAGITLPNDASVGLHRNVGFELVGTYRNVGYKLGAWRDVMWLARPLRPFDPHPSEPRLLTALRAEEIERALVALPQLSPADPR